MSLEVRVAPQTIICGCIWHIDTVSRYMGFQLELDIPLLFLSLNIIWWSFGRSCKRRQWWVQLASSGGGDSTLPVSRHPWERKMWYSNPTNTTFPIRILQYYILGWQASCRSPPLHMCPWSDQPSSPQHICCSIAQWLRMKTFRYEARKYFLR